MKKNKQLAFLLVLCLSIFRHTQLIAQSLIKQWDKTIGGSGSDGLFSILQTADGGYVLGGDSDSGISADKTSPSKGGFDFWIVKIDSTGNKLWEKTIGGINDDRFSTILQTSDGGFILGGKSNSGISGDKTETNKGGWDFWIVKLDAAGNITWDKTLGGTDEDHFYTIQQTAEGGYILGGNSLSGISGDKTQPSKGGGDYWIIKLNSSGNKLWDKTIGGNLNDILISIKQTSDGNYILGGESQSVISGDKTQSSKGHGDFWIVKLDGNGTKIWDKTIGGINYDYFNSLTLSTKGSIILSGSTDSGISGDKSEPSKGFRDFWLVKIDSSGNKLWDKTIGGNNGDEIRAVHLLTDGSLLIGGTSYSDISGDKTEASRGSSDYWIVKLDSMGNKLWDKTYGGANWDILTSLQLTFSGNCLLGGYSLSPISPDKTGANKGSWDYWVIRLRPATITGISKKDNIHVKIFPNPIQNQPGFTLTLQGLLKENVNITLYNNLGQEIDNALLKPIDSIITRSFKTNHLAKGLYFISIISPTLRISKKLIVQ